MNISKHVNISTKAYEQAVKYGPVSKRARDELFIFIHDWYATVVAENHSVENNEEIPDEMFKRFMNQIQ